ncbi:MAG: peptidogalycan biosysnthesis protein [Bacteroidales bacterium]|jgi:hypothetical protein|nr:peptidogalycan biosysnthesis protein [Bacteroidales bacterium]
MNLDKPCVKSFWLDTVKQIDERDWELIFGKSKIKSYNLFKSMEEACLANVDFSYLKIDDGKRILAIVPCFTYRLKLDVLSPSLSKIANPVRKIFPNFMSLKIFAAGSFASTCEHYIGILDNLNREKSDAVKEILNEQIKDKSKHLKAPLVFIKEIPQHDLLFVSRILTDFYFYDSLPTAFIPVGGESEPYPAALRKKERKRYRKSKDSFDKQFSWEIISDFNEHTELFTNLYLNVLEKSKNRFEELNEKFFNAINRSFAHDAFLLVARDRSNKIRVMELVLEEKDRLIPMYLGVDYPKGEDTKILYFNTIFRTIEEAERRKKSIIILGQTSYYPKVLSGAFVERVYLGFYSYIPWLQFLIKTVFKKLFMPTNVMNNIYRHDLEAKIKEKYSKFGFEIYN